MFGKGFREREKGMSGIIRGGMRVLRVTSFSATIYGERVLDIFFFLRDISVCQSHYL